MLLLLQKRVFHTFFQNAHLLNMPWNPPWWPPGLPWTLLRVMTGSFQSTQIIHTSQPVSNWSNNFISIAVATVWFMSGPKWWCGMTLQVAGYHWVVEACLTYLCVRPVSYIKLWMNRVPMNTLFMANVLQTNKWVSSIFRKTQKKSTMNASVQLTFLHFLVSMLTEGYWRRRESGTL